MGSNSRLPAPDIVREWTTEELTSWLEEANLDECAPVFQARNIDGATLLGMSYDKIITELSELKIKKRLQVAKCVVECKSQATTAKKVVSSLKKSKKKRDQMAAGSAGEPDEYDSGDDWASDEFDTDGEEEDQDYSTTVNGNSFQVAELPDDNVSSNGPGSLASSDSSGQYNDVTLGFLSSCPNMPGRTGVWNVKGPPSGKELATSNQDIGVVLKSVGPLRAEGPTVVSLNVHKVRPPIPKPPSAAPQELGKLSSTVVTRRTVPKIQRPPSQPPAPPVPAAPRSPSPPVDSLPSPDDEYEIPIPGFPEQVSQNPAPTPVFKGVAPSVSPQALRLPPITNLNNGHWQHRRSREEQTTVETPNDTYELVDQPEETYEVVDEHQSHLVSPSLPPRKPPSLHSSLMVPPLPEKPSKMMVQVSPNPSNPNVDSALPPLPSKGLSASKSMSQLRNIVQSKFLKTKSSFRRDSNGSSKDGGVLEPPISVTQVSMLNGPITVTVNGSPTGSPGNHASPSPPNAGHPVSSPLKSPSLAPAGPRSLPKSNSVTSFEDMSSMTLRPLPPVPPSQPTSEESLQSLPYYKDIERQEAEQLLLSLQEEDAYLVRPSRRGGITNPYTLTLIHNRRPFHLNIRLRPDGQYALGRRKDNEMMFPSVSSLVSHHQGHPIYLAAQGENMGTSLLRWHP